MYGTFLGGRIIIVIIIIIIVIIFIIIIQAMVEARVQHKDQWLGSFEKSGTSVWRGRVSNSVIQ